MRISTKAVEYQTCPLVDYGCKWQFWCKGGGVYPSLTAGSRKLVQEGVHSDNEEAKILPTEF